MADSDLQRVLYSEQNKGQQSSSVRALRTLLTVMGIAVAVQLVFGLQYGFTTKAAGAISLALAISGACSLAGGLLGFLFGIPRTLQEQRSSASAGADQSVQETEVAYAANTNLEQISDWLTKILVGVGLTQIKEIATLLDTVSSRAAAGLGAAAGAQIFATFIIVLYLVAGFLFGYLWTRLFLAGALRQADLSVLDRKFEEVAKSVQEFKRQEDLDARALAITQQQLDLNEDEPSIQQEELNEAIAGASDAARTTIFYQAQKIRKDHWRHPEDKPTMERTIPIFRGLIAADPSYHRDHGQLGFALKDQREPALEEAKETLSRAIALRGDWRQVGYAYYELNRATCSILLDKASAGDQESSKELVEAVMPDLQVVADAGYGGVLRDDPIIQEWLTRNKLSQAIRY